MPSILKEIGSVMIRPILAALFLIASCSFVATAQASDVAPLANACQPGSQVQCTSGMALQYTTLGYSKAGSAWTVQPTAGLGVGYQFRQGFLPLNGNARLLLTEVVFGGYANKDAVNSFQLAAGATIGYQWNGTSCSIGLAEDLFNLGSGKASGILTPFSSLGNLHWIIALGVPLG